MIRKFLSPILCIALLATPILAQPLSDAQKQFERTNPAIMKLFRQVTARPSESAVRILCKGKDVALGAVVDANGLILTKGSLLTSDITCKLKDGRVFPAEIIGEHQSSDLALLKIQAMDLVPVQWRPGKLTPAGTLAVGAAVAGIEHLRQGMWVISVGPGADPVAIGVIGVLARPFKLGDQPPGGFLGVILDTIEKGAGARIKEFAPDSAARKAGFKINDYILEAGTAKILDAETLQITLQARKPGDEVLFKVLRGMETLTLKATLGKGPPTNKQDLMGSQLSERRGGFPSIIQTDSVLSPRDCGGPLVDLDGKTIGINIARAGRTETYAIPAEAVLGLLDDLKSGKLARIEAKPAEPFKAIETFQVAGKLSKSDARDSRRDKTYQQVHKVHLAGGIDYTIELKSNAFDALLRVEDSRGKQLAEDDDSGVDLNARLVFRAPADGEYRIIVTSFREAETGDYTLTIRQTPKK